MVTHLKSKKCSSHKGLDFVTNYNVWLEVQNIRDRNVNVLNDKN